MTPLTIWGGALILPVVLVVIWSLVWKGWALWLAAHRGEKVWFVALLAINTLGILEVVYIFLVAKKRDTK